MGPGRAGGTTGWGDNAPEEPVAKIRRGREGLAASRPIRDRQMGRRRGR
jgi:hypothetical protein